jgi:hypothetical protein
LSAAQAGLSLREFARRDGCNDKLVRRAIQQGRLKAFEDGTLDAALVGSGWRTTNRRADKGADTADTGGPVRTGPESTAEGLGDGSFDEFVQLVLSGQSPDFAKSEQIKEAALALLRVMEARQKAGSLIDLATAEAVIFETFRSARDAWNNWPTRVGPLIAADLGLEAERVTEILKAHVHQHLIDLGEPEPDFNEGQG